MKRTSRAFTLVELAIVLAIAGILLAIAVPRYQSYIDRTRLVQAVAEIGDMSTTIKKRQITTGALPDSLADVGLDNKLDPWGRPYEYLNLATLKGNGQARKDKKLAPLNSDFDLYSVGADGLTKASLVNQDSRDDVVRARDGGFIGLASDFDP
jgi:general secretion pathway protein G